MSTQETQETQENLEDPRGIFIEDILEAHDPVLIDTNVISPTSLLHFLYDSNTYESIDTELLEQEPPVQQLFLKVLDHENILTIPQVTKEFYALIPRLKAKIRYLNHNKKYDISLSHKNQELLETICQNAEKMHELLSFSQLNIDDKSYETLFEIVRTAQKTLHLKENTDLKYGAEDTLKKENDTDERLVAALYWVCLNPGTKPTIVSGDYDILRLVGAIYNCFPNYHLSPYNESFKKSVSNAKPVVYLSDFENVGWNRRFELEDAAKKSKEKIWF